MINGANTFSKANKGIGYGRSTPPVATIALFRERCVALQRRIPFIIGQGSTPAHGCATLRYNFMLQITPNILLDENEIHEEFIRSSGAGGQNVNKVSTAVQLRFDVAGSLSLPAEVRENLLKMAGKRISQNGVLLIKAQSHRTQERNRQEAQDRLIALIIQAAHKPVLRRATKPSRASQQRRLESKRRHSETKQARRAVSNCED